MDTGSHFLRFKGLGNIIICTHFQQRDFILQQPLGGDYDHRNRRALMLPQIPEKFLPGHPRQHQIQQDKVRHFPFRCHLSLCSGKSLQNLIVFFPQYPGQKVIDIRLIFHN